MSLKLTDLEPRWLSDNVFTFKCPHCVSGGREKPYWLCCKNVAMDHREQFRLFYENGGFARGNGFIVVPMRADAIWTWNTRDFATMSVTPSIDASPSGDWHGHITNGEIR